MSAPVRFVLVGAGGIAQSYVQAFDGNPAARLVAVVDSRFDVAKATADSMNCLAFSSWSEFASSGPEVDAAVICTPPVTHEEIATGLLNRGIHVLCEKPFTLEPASAKKMIAVAEAKGRLLTMASKFRYVEDVIRAKSIVTSGILGDIILFENAFTARVDMSSRWNSNPAISGGGVLIDNGTHSVDIMRYFLGPLSDVQVVEGKRSQNLPVEDTVRMFVRSAAGVMGSVDLSWSINKELDSYINIYGSQGTIQVGWKESKYRQSSSREWVVFGKGYNKVQAFRDQIANFTRAVRGTELLRITSEDALASVEMVQAAYNSMQMSNWIHVNSNESKV